MLIQQHLPDVANTVCMAASRNSGGRAGVSMGEGGGAGGERGKGPGSWWGLQRRQPCG